MRKHLAVAGLAILLAVAFGGAAYVQLTQRIYLVAPIDMYVSPLTANPPGAPNNPCTVSLPCSSPGSALRLLHSNYDLGGLPVAARIHVKVGNYNLDGAYGAPNTTAPWNQVIGPFVGASGDVAVQVLGDSTNPLGAVMQPLSGYCFDLQEGAGIFIDYITCDQSLNTSNPFGPGQDMISVYRASVTIKHFVFGDHGVGTGPGAIAPFNDITAIRSTVNIVGCPKPTGTNPWSCWIGFSKVAGHKYQAHVLCDGCYFIQNNNNCIDPDPNKWCTPYYVLAGSAAPTFTTGIIAINGGIVNWGAFAVPSSTAFHGDQCSVRTNGIVFTAGLGNGPQPNYALPGSSNTCATSKGGQVE